MKIERIHIGDLVNEIYKPDRLYRVKSIGIVNGNGVRVVDVKTGTEEQIFSADELELAGYRYKLAPWNTYITTTLEKIGVDYCIEVYYNRYVLYTTCRENRKLIGEYNSTDDAKKAAANHLNYVMEEVIKEFKNKI